MTTLLACDYIACFVEDWCKLVTVHMIHDSTHKKNMWNTKSSEMGPKYQNVVNTRHG